MAEGVVDRLVIATEFDESGLDRGTKAQLAHLERFVAQVGLISRNLPEISIDASQVTSALEKAGGDLDQFASLLGQLSPDDFAQALDTMVQELGEAGSQFKATSAEGRAIQAAIDALTEAQTRAATGTDTATAALQREAVAATNVARGIGAATGPLVQQSAAFQQARASAATLTVALAATGEATRALAAQGTQPVALNVQPALNAADTLISRMGLAQRSVTSLRSVLSVPLPPVPPDPNLPILARGYEGFAHRAAEARLEAEALKRTMLGLNGATRGGATGAEKWADGIGNLRAQTAGLTSGLVGSALQASKLRSGLTGLALAATGAAGPVGQLAQSVLLFGGTGAVAGVALGVAALAALYRLLGTAAREAREEQDRLVQGLLAEANSAVPKAVQAHQALAAALAAEARAREALSRIQLVGRAATAAAGAAGAITNLPSGQIAAQVQQELARRQIKAIADIQRAQRQAADANKAAVLEFQSLNVRTLTEAISLNRANAFQIDQARGFERVLTQQASDTTLTIRERLDAYQQLIGLQKALTAESQRTLDFWKQFRAAEDQILDAQIQLVRLGFGDPSILTKALKEAAATARDLTQTEEVRIAAANRLNTAAAVLVAPLERQVQATGASADNILRAFRATQSLTGLDAVLGLTADSAQVTDEIAKAERELAALRSQAVSLRIDGDAAPVLRSIATVEARLADLRTERAQITLTGDSRVLTDQIAEAESQLERLRAQGGVAVGIDGDAFALLAEITKVETRLVGLRGDRGAITLTGDTTRLTQQITEAEEQLARLRAEGVALSLTADPTEILRQIATVEDRLGQLRGQGKLIALAGDTDTGPLARQIADLDAALGRLRASGGAATDAFRQMQQQRTGLVEKQREAEQLVAAFLRIGQAPLELKFEATLDLRDPDKALADLLKELEKRADEKAFAVTLKALRAPVEIDTSLIGDAERVLEDFNTDLARQNPIWREANIQAAKMVKKLDDGRSNAQRLADTLADAFAIMDAFEEFGTATGILSEQDIRAFQVFQDAATSVTKFATGDIVGGLVAAMQTLGGIFGGGESEHDRIVRENTEAIKRNTADRSTEFAGIGGTEDLARSIEQVIADNLGAVALAANDIGTIRTTGSAILEREFLALGVSLEDLQRVAEAHGLDVLDEKGRLVGGALDQLRAEILDVIQQSLKFADTLSDLTLAADLRARITGEELDPSASFQRQLDAAFDLKGFAVTDFFEGIDLGDPDALRRASLGLLDAFENGQLDASKLGKLSREDILRILGDAAGLIESLGESALDAANELSIIPKGFRQAALAFEAQIPGLGPTAAAPVLKAVDIPLVDLAVDATDALERLIPEPILITGAELLDRMVAFGAIPATTGLPAGVPSDGAALPLIAASLGSATAALAQIAASVSSTAPATQVKTNQELSAAVSRLMELLAKAKIGQSFGDVILQLPSTGQDAYEQAVDVRRALEDISMADYGRTDRWGQT